MPKLPGYVRDDVLLLLIFNAQKERTVKYGSIMRACGISRGQAADNGNATEDIVGAISKWTFAQWGVHLASIVVKKDTGYPGDAFFGLPGIPARFRRESDLWTNQAASTEAKAFIDECQKEVFAWANVCRFSITMPPTKRKAAASSG